MLWMGAIALIFVAVVAGIADWRRARRSDPDAVGVMPWQTIQIVAIFVAVLLIALHFAQ